MEAVRAYAPGKLMLAGEVSVLEIGNRCLVAALDRGVTVTACPHTSWVLHAPDVGIFEQPLSGQVQEHGSDSSILPLSALRVAGTFLQEQGYALHPLHVSVHSAISTMQLSDGTVTKPGLGSSSATIVALIKAVLTSSGCACSNEHIFKLATIAQCWGSNYIGSCFDIAAAAFGSPLMYSRFDPDWLKQVLDGELELSKVIDQAWPGLYIQPVCLPESLNLAIGFTGKSVQTSNVIIQLEAFKRRSPRQYRAIMTKLNATAQALIVALQQGAQKDVFEVCQVINNVFVVLENQSGITCITKELETLIKIAHSYGVGAKQSGAGGGDCGIALCFQSSVADRIKEDWNRNGIMSLNMDIAR